MAGSSRTTWVTRCPPWSSPYKGTKDVFVTADNGEFSARNVFIFLRLPTFDCFVFGGGKHSREQQVMHNRGSKSREGCVPRF